MPTKKKATVKKPAAGAKTPAKQPPAKKNTKK
jgi:hypothetical protein